MGSFPQSPHLCMHTHTCLANVTLLILSTAFLLLFHDHLWVWLIYSQTLQLSLPSYLKLKILVCFSFFFPCFLLLRWFHYNLSSYLLLWLKGAHLGVLKQGRRVQKSCVVSSSHRGMCLREHLLCPCWRLSLFPGDTSVFFAISSPCGNQCFSMHNSMAKV